MSQQASHFNEAPLLDWPYVVPTALVQRIIDSAAVERVESSPANWLAWQRQRVGELVAYVKSINPWWDERLGGGGGDTERVLATLESWHSVPVLSRAELRQSVEAIPSPQLIDQEDPPQACSTRGSTGEPLVLLRSQQASRINGHHFHADHLRHGRPLYVQRAVIGMLEADHEGTHTWLPSVGELNEGVVLLRYAPKFSLAQHLQWLRDGQIWQLTVATDFLASLVDFSMAEAEKAAQNGSASAFVPLQIGQILTAGGPVSAELRANTKKYLGADVFDRYVCEEVGLLASQARGAHLSFDAQNPGAAAPVAYNISLTNVLLEVLRPDGTHVADGEEGAVTVTALHQFAHPVIRYALGDTARWHARCPQSGALLPSLTEIRRTT
jgi:phenylacetate-CoA ligase